MINLNIIGSFFGCDGYSSHTRQLTNASNKFDDINISLSTNLTKGWNLDCSDEELKMIKKDAGSCDTNLMIATPNSWEPYLAEGKKFIGFLVFEGDRIPAGWLKILNDDRVNQIWVPSQHTLDAVYNTLPVKGTIDTQLPKWVDKIKIVPHGVDSTIFFPIEIKKEKFTFVTNKGLRDLQDRGGTQYLLKAYLEEFTSKDNVSLLVKINPAYGVPDIANIIKQLKITNPDIPGLKFSIENLPYKALNKLYNTGDVFVAPTRAEAFHLGCIEALACGLPVITTDFGGQTDYIEDNINGWINSGELEEIKHDVMYEGIKWLTPDITELRGSLRYCYNNQDQLHILKENCLNTAKRYSWDNSAEIAHSLLLQ